MSHSQLSLSLLFCFNISVCNLADIIHLWSLFQSYNVTRSWNEDIYRLLYNRICEHGKNLKKGSH